MRAFLTFLFLISIPLLVALGHDAYFYLDNQYRGDGTQDFMLSDVGFLWDRYAPEGLKVTRESFDPAEWDLFYKYVLTQYAVVIAGFFAFFFYILTFLLKMLRVWPFNTGSVNVRRKNRKVDVILGDAKESGYKYKRK